VFVYGNSAEAAAEEIDAGDLIAVDGRLGWKSTLKKDGTKLGLCVTTFGVDVLVKAEVPVPALDLEAEPAWKRAIQWKRLGGHRTLAWQTVLISPEDFCHGARRPQHPDVCVGVVLPDLSRALQFGHTLAGMAGRGQLGGRDLDSSHVFTGECAENVPDRARRHDARARGHPAAGGGVADAVTRT
jgi:hypothetical protein